MARNVALIASVVFASAWGITAVAQEPATVKKTEARSEAGAGESEAAPSKVRAPAASRPSLPGGPDSFTAGCCSSPPPFPGLNCCDFTDCGWFDCNEAGNRATKRYRR
jgi:hypothetical protein